jgi:DNA-binding transcriptional LysR family regulator
MQPSFAAIGVDAAMNLQHLKTFIRVAELGSLSKASDRMRIAQPALSRQMKLLQDEIGVPLFERHRGGMRLTQAGDELLQRVSGLVRQLDQAYADVRSMSGAPGGQVAFGIVPTVSHVLSARLARRVAADFPGISLRIVEGYAGHQTEWLQKGEIDVAIMYGPAADFHMKTTELLVEELALVGPPDSDLSSTTPVSVAAFARLPLVLPSRPHGLRMVVEAAALKVKAKLDVRFEADSFHVLKDLVEKGLGFTALPLSAIASEARQGLLKHAPLIKPKVTRQLILGVPESMLSHATRTVIGLALQEIVTLVRAGEWQAQLLFKSDQPWR